jgi:murein DD-endopeptidase MepM/ murein hydrolase activator NlpD
VRAALVALLLLLAPYPGCAGSLDLDGPMIQGGLLFGRAEPGTTVTLDGEPVRLRADGRFLIGFAYNAPVSATFEAVFPGGGRETRRLTIEQRDYEVQKIEGLPQDKVTPDPKQMERVAAEQELVAAARGFDSPFDDFITPLQWPAQGPLSGFYGSRRILNGEERQPHFGLDIAAPEGAPVVAPLGGLVRMAESDLFFTGGTIIIDHGFGLTTAYSHLSAVEVTVGQRVEQGQEIGRVGATGRVTGAHLDFRVNLFDVRLDPALLLPPHQETAQP